MGMLSVLSSSERLEGVCCGPGAMLPGEEVGEAFVLTQQT